MAGLAITRLDMNAQDLRRRALRVSKPGVACRLLALALVPEDRTRTDAAQSCGMDRQTLVSVVDTTDWKVEKTIPMPGPGFFLRSHENTPYAWADAYMGKEKDVVPVIDLRTLEVAKLLRPAPGKLTAHVEFTRDGRYALLSVMEDDGALIVLDAATFEEVKRLPMGKPIGKYNVWNKINYSSGTSH